MNKKNKCVGLDYEVCANTKCPNEKIIINSIDVSEYFIEVVDEGESTIDYKILPNCERLLVEKIFNQNQQISRLQEENKELRQVRKNSLDIQEPYIYLYRQIKKQCHKLEEENKELEKLEQEYVNFRVALGDIKNIIEFRFKTAYMTLGLKETDKIIEDIDKIVNEVLKQ